MFCSIHSLRRRSPPPIKEIRAGRGCPGTERHDARFFYFAVATQPTYGVYICTETGYAQGFIDRLEEIWAFNDEFFKRIARCLGSPVFDRNRQLVVAIDLQVSIEREDRFA